MDSRHLSQTRALRVLKEVAEALNSATTNLQLEALGYRTHEFGDSAFIEKDRLLGAR